MDNEYTRGSRSSKVHKFPLYTQSSYFKKLLGGDFKESNSKTITLHDDDPDVLNLLLRYLYRHQVVIIGPGIKSMTLSVSLYAIADKYSVPSLCTLAANRFSDVLDLAADLEDYFTAIKTIKPSVYEGDKTLWDIVVRVTRRHISFLLC